jgi:hypothetical protein
LIADFVNGYCHAGPWWQGYRQAGGVVLPRVLTLAQSIESG